MKALKWIGLGLGGLVLLLLVVVGVVFLLGYNAINRTYDLPDEGFTATAGDVERGDYIVNAIAGCMGCHGEGLRGNVFINEPPVGYLPAPNLTSGQGGAASTFTDADFEHAIRHGVGADGRPLIIMPAHQYTVFSDEDLASLVAYIRSLPPVDNNLGDRRPHPLGYILMGAGLFGELPAQVIDHDADHVTVPRGPTVEYGAYLVRAGACRDCHGPLLNGESEGGDPNAPPAPNLTPAGDVGTWSEAEFIQTLHTGTTPDGRALSDEMPWMIYGRQTDEDLAAIYAYLRSLPPSGE